MKRSYASWAGLGLALLGLTNACAQAEEPANAPDTPLADVTATNEAQTVVRFLQDSRSSATLSSLRLGGHSFVSRTGFTHLRMTQEVEGVRVHGAYVKATLDGLGQVTHVIDRLVTVPSDFRVATGGEERALRAALSALGRNSYRPTALPSEELHVARFTLGQDFVEPARVEHVGYVDGAGKLLSGYLVETWTHKQNLLHETLVDASGKVISTELRTNSDRYNVFVEDPGKGPQVLVDGPLPGGVESPNGWLGTATQRTTDISGNNVRAYLDANADNRADSGGTTITTGSFTATVDLTAQPATANNRAVATQEIFYLTNRLHDLLYRHGFNEAAGNFQTSNFSRGGRGNDAVLAEVQDGSGTDNANFSTPSDGRAPRMQMYLWSGPDPDAELTVASPASAAGTYKARTSTFGPALTTTGITGNIVLINDGTGTPTDGCERITTVLTGKVALIDRGTCEFGIKVQNAQAAGAIAALVANNAGGTEVFSMGSTTASGVRIPSAMITQNDGALLRNAAGVTGTTRKLLVQPLLVDGDLDSDIVFHEYGHGLSWRMIGNMSGRISGALGEGASDGLAILINGDDRVGEYAAGRPAGIRRFPYAGYPLTYGDVTGAVVHNDGEIYGAIIWRLKELFNAEGVSDDELLGYYVDGMNYTPSAPAYEDMRDGIVEAVLASGTGLECLVWQAFAQFGVGVGADGRVVGAGVSITESFDLPVACQ